MRARARATATAATAATAASSAATRCARDARRRAGGDARARRRFASTATARGGRAPRRRNSRGRGAACAPEGLGDAARRGRRFVARWEAAGARASATPAALTSLRPSEDAAAKLSVENAVYESDVFRKMHCELAWGDGGFEVLHVVMYPWAERAAPVFPPPPAADVVGLRRTRVAVHRRRRAG